MDLTKYEANHNHMFYHSFATQGNQVFDSIYVPFIPDYMIVRCLNYTPVAADTQGTYAIWCDLVGQNIGSFIVQQIVTGAPPQLMSSMPVTPNMIFKINKPVTSNVLFQFNVLPNNPELLLGGSMAMHLEFVKLKSDKPQKIF